MSAIVGFSEMLEIGSGAAMPEEDVESVRAIRESAERMARLLDDLLEFSIVGRDALCI